MLPPPVCFSISDGSQVGYARRAAVQLVEGFAFDEVDAGHVAIVVSELATNLAKHAEGGLISLRLIETFGRYELEIVCVDCGRGIVDVSKCFEDGYSTSGTPGSGLGAVRRLSRTFDIFSQPGKGTVQVSRMARRMDPHLPHTSLEIAGLSVPIAGETECGDAWCAVSREGMTRLLVADGLGHGSLAAIASREAVQVLQATVDRSLRETLDAMHLALRATRGAAVAIAELHPRENSLHFSGVGNIAGFIATPNAVRNQNLVSINGTLGCLAPKFKEFTYSLPPGSRVVLYSDGLHSQVRFDGYSGLASRHPAITAGLLYRDFQRGRDDATVVVAHVE